MIYIFLGIIFGMIITIFEIKFNFDKSSIYVGLIIGIIMCLIVFCPKTNEIKDYIQNLEEKLNIYESKYEEHCLEDSKRQVE